MNFWGTLAAAAASSSLAASADFSLTSEAASLPFLSWSRFNELVFAVTYDSFIRVTKVFFMK
jgi:hypothetical protein